MKIKKEMKQRVEKCMPSLIQWRSQLQYEKKTKKKNDYFAKMDEAAYPQALKELYHLKIGHELNLDNPLSYTEKIQWSKLYDRDPRKSQYSDRYSVREWVKETIGEKYLVPLIAVWESTEDINFESLPDSFVLKLTNAAARNIIVPDKGKMNKLFVKRQLKFWMGLPFGYATGLELHYLDIQPRIIAEEFLPAKEGDDDLHDYKFLCFGGEIAFIWVDIDRFNEHKRVMFDENWNRLPFSMGQHPTDIEVEKPENFDEMKRIARRLSADFSHVRVDLYDNDNGIYFGEMTFSTSAGFSTIRPEEYDRTIGDLWVLPINE